MKVIALIISADDAEIDQVRRLLAEPDLINLRVALVELRPRIPRVTNQQFMNAARDVGRALGHADWFAVMIKRVGLEWIAAARGAMYSGPGLDEIPNWTDDERERMRKALGMGFGSGAN